MSPYLWGVPNTDGPLETWPPQGDARDLLGTTGQAGARSRGAASPILSHIGQRKVALDWLKTMLALPLEAKPASWTHFLF
jgi:hypothetical protein